MRSSTADILHDTQRCQARLLLVCSMEWATPLDTPTHHKLTTVEELWFTRPWT